MELKKTKPVFLPALFFAFLTQTLETQAIDLPWSKADSRSEKINR